MFVSFSEILCLYIYIYMATLADGYLLPLFAKIEGHHIWGVDVFCKPARLLLSPDKNKPLLFDGETELD